MTSRKLDCAPEFVAAVMALAREKDHAPLVDLLLSGYPKTDDERVLLAAYHSGAFKRRPGNPGDKAVAAAAELYPKVMRELRLLPETAGLRVHPRQLQKAALACTRDYLRHHGQSAPDPQKAMNRISRSKKPRTKR